MTFSILSRGFERSIIAYPRVTLLFILLLTAVMGYQARLFRLNADSETLIMESDKDLRYLREVTARYGTQDFLLLMAVPHDSITTPAFLAELGVLRDKVAALKRIDHVTTILDVPLLECSGISLTELGGELPTLETAPPSISRAAMIAELRNSPLYSNQLMSRDSDTTALLITFKHEDWYYELLRQRDELLNRQAGEVWDEDLQEQLALADNRLAAHRREMAQGRRQDIILIRDMMANHHKHADLFLGGVSMIENDLIDLIKRDLKIFSFAILITMAIMLGVIFHKWRWVLLPIFSCLISLIWMIGLLGTFDWKVTVVSSNFISLQFIITLAIILHLIVHYRLLCRTEPTASQAELVRRTIGEKFRPCLFAVLTTIVGFGSLLFCDMLPVITFGWMMMVGLIVSLLVTFLFFPAALMLFPRETHAAAHPAHYWLTDALARFTLSCGKVIILAAVVMLILGIVGMSRLTVENSFINYFHTDSDIYQGLSVIDRQLGGTTPLDVIVQLGDPCDVMTDVPLADGKSDNAGAVTAASNDSDASEAASSAVPADNNDDDWDEFGDEFDQFDDYDQYADMATYWFTTEKLYLVEKAHAYLEELEETGKVMSLATLLQVAQRVKGEPLDNLELTLLFNKVPPHLAEMLIDPYVSIPANELRLSVRIRDTWPHLRRNALLNQIQRELPERLDVDPRQVRLTGLMVLYNNMLQNLFKSQILTLGLTAMIMALTFLILFRSVRIAAAAMIANALPILVVLGVIGWANIPLDMMTITIAAIGIGIAVDDAIHYIYRFRREFERCGNYVLALQASHSTVGRAMYYTSITIIIGFSVLAFSNFIPGIYFGLLTSLAMAIALLTDLTLLPRLLILFKPLGPERPAGDIS